jgi:hypothetical protein
MREAKTEIIDLETRGHDSLRWLEVIQAARYCLSMVCERDPRAELLRYRQPRNFYRPLKDNARFSASHIGVAHDLRWRT